MDPSLLVLGVILLVVISVLFSALILNMATKFFKVENSNYKTAIKILIIHPIIYITAACLLVIMLPKASGLFIVIFSCWAFHMLMQRYYKTGFKKNIAIFATYMILTVVLTPVIILPVKTYIFQPFTVKGSAMEPSFKDGDYLLIKEFDTDYQRGDVIVFRYPLDQSEFFIKRVIGLPGETVEVKDGKVKIYNKENPNGFQLNESEYLADTVTTAGSMSEELGSDEYFVLGDNRGASSDSRRWGLVPKSNIVGEAWLKPFSDNN